MGVPDSSVERGPFVSWRCGSLHRASSFPGSEPLFIEDRCLLPSPKTTTGKVLCGPDLSGGTRARCQGRYKMAVERAASLFVRRHDGQHAGYSRKSKSLSPGLQSKAR